MERAKGFEPSTQKSEVAPPQVSPRSSQDGYTQLCAQIPDAAWPEVSRVVAAWAKLPLPLKAAILAIIDCIRDEGETGDATAAGGGVPARPYLYIKDTSHE